MSCRLLYYGALWIGLLHGQGLTIRMRVEAPDGRFVAGLKPEDFRVKVDGRDVRMNGLVEQNGPLAVGIVVDGSRRLAGNQERLRMALGQFLVKARPTDEFFVVMSLEKPLLATGFTHNVVQVAQSVTVPAGNRETRVYDAMGLALDQLQRSQLSRRVLIVFCDSNDFASRERPSALFPKLLRSGVEVHVIDSYPDYGDWKPQTMFRLEGVTAEAGGTFRYQPDLARWVNELKGVGIWRSYAAQLDVPGGKSSAYKVDMGWAHPRLAQGKRMRWQRVAFDR